MARGDSLDRLISVGLTSLIIYGTYKISLTGTLGKDMQRFSQSIQSGLKNGVVPDNLDLPSIERTCTGTGDIAWMIASDSAFETHVSDWKAARVRAGESKYDWNAFRVHEKAITNWFDPGNNPPAMFCG